MILFLRTILSDKPVVLIGLCLLSIVAFMMGAWFVASAFADESQLAKRIAADLNPSKDRSMFEVVGYSITFVAVVNFMMVFLVHRSRPFFFLTLFSGFLWFDDAASYHENAGRFLVRTFDLPALSPGLRPQDTGELVAWALAGGSLGLVLIWALRGRIKGDLDVLWLMLSLFAALILCGVVFDFAHVATSTNRAVFGFLEDGGELVVLTLIAICAIGAVRNMGKHYAQVA